MYTPRINWVLFSLFALVTIGVFAVAMISPPFREIAYAPIRELVLPPPTPVVLSVLYSTEKEAWLNDVVADFEKTNPKINGHPVKIVLEKMGSWEINAAVLDEHPTVMADQEVNFPAVTYWEGAVRFEGTCTGEPVNRNGYIELTGYTGNLPLP